MGSEKENPFKQFIESLDSINGLGEKRLIIPNQNADYVDSLIRGYGLLPDEEARQMLITMLDNMEDANLRYLRMADKQYLIILLWDLFVHCNKNQMVPFLWRVFWLGIMFGEMVDWEDIDDPPK